MSSIACWQTTLLRREGEAAPRRRPRRPPCPAGPPGGRAWAAFLRGSRRPFDRPAQCDRTEASSSVGPIASQTGGVEPGAAAPPAQVLIFARPAQQPVRGEEVALPACDSRLPCHRRAGALVRAARSRRLGRAAPAPAAMPRSRCPSKFAPPHIVSAVAAIAFPGRLRDPAGTALTVLPSTGRGNPSRVPSSGAPHRSRVGSRSGSSPWPPSRRAAAGRQ